jgi:hypothetical protein
MREGLDCQTSAAVYIYGLNLQLFADGGDGGAGAAAPSDGGQTAAPTETGVPGPDAGGKRARGRKADPFANVVFGIDEGQQIATSPSAPRNDRGASSGGAAATFPGGEGNGEEGAAGGRASFDELIKGEYKADFDARVQDILGKRFKTAKAAEERLAKLEPTLALIADRYGVKPGQDGSLDMDAVIKAVNDDDEWFERQAAERGMSVDTFKQVHQLEQEAEQRRRQDAVALEEQQRRAAFEQLVRQSEEARKIYPGFDLRQEMQNPAFVRLTGVGIDAKTAYEVIHKDQILGAGMQYAAQTAAKKVADSVASGARRPVENGLGGRGTAPVRITDPKQMTPEQRRELRRRVANGERVVF